MIKYLLHLVDQAPCFAVVPLSLVLLAATVLSAFAIDFQGGDLRDPFENALLRAIEASRGGEEIIEEPPAIVPEAFSGETAYDLQGIVWNSKMPQVIVNGEVLKVGDKLGEAEVRSIERKGVEIETPAGIVFLTFEKLKEKTAPETDGTEEVGDRE